MELTLQVTAATNFIFAITETTTALSNPPNGVAFYRLSDGYQQTEQFCGKYLNPANGNVYNDAGMTQQAGTVHIV